MTRPVKPRLPKRFTPSETDYLKKQLIRDGYRMTRRDFAKASGKLVSGMNVGKAEKMAWLFHYDCLRIALHKGKTIPPSVLKDYPRSKYPKLYTIGGQYGYR